MKKFGFIGFGNMAKMIINCLIKYGNINPGEIFVTRGDKSRLSEIGGMFEGVTALTTSREVEERADITFLCAKPAGIKEALAEMATVAKSGTHFISLAVVLSMDELQGLYPGKITKYMPTVASETGAGVSLINHNSHVTEAEAAYIEVLLGRFGTVMHVRDEDWGFASVLSSCMPGFIASMFGHFADAALQHSDAFDKKTVSEIINGTLFGTAKLLVETGADYGQVVDRVATKGGITREGVNVFDGALPEVYDRLFEKALAKIGGAK
jgi:pyrroline-5-carboxylate reductase